MHVWLVLQGIQNIFDLCISIFMRYISTAHSVCLPNENPISIIYGNELNYLSESFRKQYAVHTVSVRLCMCVLYEREKEREWERANENEQKRDFFTSDKSYITYIYVEHFRFRSYAPWIEE